MSFNLYKFYDFIHISHIFLSTDTVLTPCVFEMHYGQEYLECLFPTNSFVLCN